MYKATIINSDRQYTPREEIALRDMSRHNGIEKGLKINNVKGFVLFSIENDRAENPNYEQLVIIADGATYATGSTSFIADFIDIFNTVKGDGEPINVLVGALESKNYRGNEFFKCYLDV